MAKRLTLYIGIALIVGIIVGAIINATASPEIIAEVVKYLGLVTFAFLRLIKMIIAPLVFGTLVAGIAHMGDTAALGRVGLRSILWFLAASIVSLSLGLILVNLFQPGVGIGLALPPATAEAGVAKTAFDAKKFVGDIIPMSIVDAMATNTILQIVVFSVFFGVAMTAVGEKAAPIVRAVDSLVDVMLVVTGYVMRFAPFAVFAAVASVIAEEGLGILAKYIEFIATFYLGLAILWVLLIGACFLIIGGRALSLVRYIREPLLVAFSTASSEAAFPRTLDALDRFGVPRRIGSFVLPLGYSFNLDGSMMYMTFATIFIAQAYGIDLTLGQEILMLLTLMLTSKGMAAVPRASLVVISATLAMFGIPEAGLLLILGVDHFLDMGRTATNVVGNTVASVVIAKWEGGLDAPESPEHEPPHAPSSHEGTARPAPREGEPGGVS
ncbi:MAG: dicarboxylate/amino acid:cation symporter [Sphingomonadaceae bacterium]|jgi:Na+/H+-dicarboxylate symporter